MSDDPETAERKMRFLFALRSRGVTDMIARLLGDWNRAKPMLRSISAIALDTAGCEMPSTSAARAVVPVAITARKTSTCLRFMADSCNQSEDFSHAGGSGGIENGRQAGRKGKIHV